jgi:hypothetical protein
MGKEILSLLKRDLILGFYTIRFRWMFSILIMLVIMLLSLHQIRGLAEVTNMDFSTFTYTDLLFSIFKGTEYQMLGDPESRFPFSWFCIQMLVPFMIGGYLRDDLFHQSSFLLIRVKHRSSIIFSKLLFAFTVVTSLYLFIIIGIMLLSSFFLSFSQVWSDYGKEEIESILISSISPLELSISMVALPFFLSLITAVLQAVLTVFMRPIYATLILLSALAVSVYSTSRLLPGSYSMILRHHSLDSFNGFTWFTVIIYMVIVLSVFVYLGYILFKNMDIFPKGKD